jgi:hypothetical protein
VVALSRSVGVLVAVMVTAVSSVAGALEETSCTTSVECSGLKCIDGRCVDVDALMRGELPTHTSSMMFGNGRGYGAVVAAADITGAVASLVLVVIGVASNSAVPDVAAMFPASLAGSITHFAYGRAGPGFISLFAWASVGATTAFVAGLAGLAANGDRFFGFDSSTAWITGVSFAAAGTALLTWLDVWMARRVHEERRTTLRIMPGFATTRGGAVGSLGGTW